MATRTRFRGPGRPPAHESRNRVADIVAAAQIRFIEDGFGGAALSAIAADAGLSLASLYHYFPDKTTLFEVVYRDTLELIWAKTTKKLERLDPSMDLVTRIATTMAPSKRPADDVPSTFFASAQVHARRIPELRHLLDERDHARRRAFGLLIGTLAEEGRIRGAQSTQQAIDLFEVIFSGWAFEGFFRPDRRQGHFESALAILEALTVEGD